MNKKELRKTIRERKRQFTRQQLYELSLSVIDRLKKHERFVEAKTVLLYYSLPDEVNTHELVASLKGKTIVLPKVIDSENMILCEYSDSNDLQEGAFHIMEPAGRVFDNYEKIDLAVVPGMAFDNDGNRLGRGKGYYDRLLSCLNNTYKIGICFQFQMADHIPTEPTDIKMDEVIS